MLGDVDDSGVVDMTDLSIIALRILRENEFNDKQEKAADVNNDGVIDITDLTRVLQFVKKKIDKI